MRQRDLLRPDRLTLKPAAGLTGPRLWVRRLAIWKEPGGDLVRDVHLRPGLNVIWSPDGSDEISEGGDRPAIGHGSGKTLLCRLLRYCLGEQRFADEEQRSRIVIAFPDGLVGAEIMVDGVCWAVVRPLGHRRRHVAVPDGDLERIAAGEGAATGIEPLIEAIEQRIVTPEVAGLVRLQRGQKAWPVALAWLTRDQECRFDDVLDWRSPASGSDAPLPASGRETGPRREALRAFLRAITEEEQRARQSEEELRAQLQSAEKEAEFLAWDGERRKRRLLADLQLEDRSLPEMPLLLEALRKAAADRLTEAASMQAGDPTDLTKARQARDAARLRHSEIEEEHKQLERVLPAEERVLALLQSEIPGLTASTLAASSAICPICDVPIEKALAEGCRISLKQHDEQACRSRLEEKQREVGEQRAKVTQISTTKSGLLPALAIAKQQREAAEKQVGALEAAHDERNAAWEKARRIRTDVEAFAEVDAQRLAAKEQLREIDEEIARLRNQLATLRDRQAAVFGSISEKFDLVVRRLLKQEASGTVNLTGSGLFIKIDVGGDRRTAAIESLKVIAFDLACLCESIEGRTNIPAFFLHDSPREADLGLSIYDELFRFVREIEELDVSPYFQYIITTTTRPPQELRTTPWLRVTLGGAPGNARLLGQDL